MINSLYMPSLSLPSFALGQGIRKWILAVASVVSSRKTERSNRLAFEDIVRENDSLIHRICFYYSCSEEEYQDLRQDILINIWRGIGEFREESRRSTWIYRVCLNTCVSNWRRNKKSQDMVSIEKIIEPSDEIDTERAERIAQLHHLISMLSAPEKALVMMWLDGQSYDEISEVTGFNRNTVATKLRRAKEKLASMAAKEY